MLLCWWMHEEAADRGSRRAAEFTPHLEKAPSCLIPLPLPFSYLSPFSPSPFRFVSSGTSSIFSSWSSSSSCLPASLTPRGQNGRCTRSYLPAASLVHLSLHEGEGLPSSPRRKTIFLTLLESTLPKTLYCAVSLLIYEYR